MVIVIPAVVAIGAAWMAQSLRTAVNIAQSNAAVRQSIAVIEGDGGKVESRELPVRLAWNWRTQRLVVSRVTFADEDAAARSSKAPFPRSEALYDALCKLPTMFCLDVRNTDFGNADLAAIRKSSIGSLIACQTELSDDAIPGARPEWLLSVDASGTRVGDSFVAWISKPGNLSAVNLEGTQTTDESVKHLVENQYLTSANIRKTKLSRASIDQLRKLPKMVLLRADAE